MCVRSMKSYAEPSTLPTPKEKKKHDTPSLAQMLMTLNRWTETRSNDRRKREQGQNEETGRASVHVRGRSQLEKLKRIWRSDVVLANALCAVCGESWEVRGGGVKPSC